MSASFSSSLGTIFLSFPGASEPAIQGDKRIACSPGFRAPAFGRTRNDNNLWPPRQVKHAIHLQGRNSRGRLQAIVCLPFLNAATGWAISATACSGFCALRMTTSAGLPTAKP